MNLAAANFHLNLAVFDITEQKSHQVTDKCSTLTTSSFHFPSTSAAAANEAQVVEVRVCLPHGGGGVA